MKTERTQNESALVCAAREGDKEALNTLLLRHWRWLKALVYSVLADAQDLDDVMQDVCLRVVSRIHTLREPECFGAWLAILARREAIKHYRGKARRPDPTTDGFVAMSARGVQRGPLERLEQRELCQKVLDAVETLPEMYREVFMLAHSGALTYAQMAEVLDVPVTTMQIRLVRARRMVQDRLSDRNRQKVHER
ncbi:MAG: RNA polymerase sigma factor [Phycisphaerales bacterium]|nr:MAG: RNA polymerase sigma factor [Phycisphaerales bacterium]